MSDEAKVVKKSAHPAINISGTCFDEYLAHVRDKMGTKAAQQTSATAIDVVGKCVAAYEEAFSAGEVGVGGSGVLVGNKSFTKSDAADEFPYATGLLYGKVQSGKTNASMATVALALANGFKCFVVLTSDNLLLGTQTADRFGQLTFGGPTIYDWREWQK